MDMGNKCGLMEQNTLESGAKIKHTARESLSMSMAMYTTAFGQMIRQTAQAHTDMSTARCTKVNGRTICSMAAELKRGPTKVDMKETTHMAASMVSAAINGQTEVNTLVIGAKTKYVDSVFIPGSTAGDMKENGTIITWRAMECTFGMMEGCMKANTKMTKRMGSAFTLGLTVDATKATGTEESNTVLARTMCRKTKRSSTVFGRMASVLSGSMSNR